MNKKISFLLLVILIAGCSQQVVKETESPANEEIQLNQLDKKRLAQEIFIDGSVLEVKGQFENAIAKYLEALKLDPQGGILYAIAKDYYAINKLSSALRFAQQAARKEPNNIEFLNLLATVYSASRMEDSSAVVLLQIISLDSTNVPAYFSLAQLDEAKRPSESIKLYKKIIDLIGPEWSVLVRLIALNERVGNIPETIKMVEQLLKLNPSDLQLQKALIDAYIKVKDYDKALAKLNEALISFPDDPNLLEFKGRILLEKGQWNNAATEYVKLIKNPKISFETKIKIGGSFLFAADKDSNNIDVAKKIFESINKDTSDWQVNAYLGEIEIKEKNDSLAIGYFKKASELAEWNEQVWQRLGGLLFDSRKYDEAITYLKKGVEKFPNNFVLNLIYGLSLSQENKHTEAKAALQNALNLNPDDVTTLSALGYTLNQLKEDDKALIHLNKALAIDPKNIQVLSIMGLIYESKKEFNVSDSLYTQALKIDSTNALILNNFAYSLSERGVRLQEALDMSKKAIMQEPKNASYLDTIGWIYFMLNKLDLAKENIEKSIALEDTNSTVLGHLGDVYFKLGNKEKAMEYWKKALSYDKSNADLKKKIEKGEL